MKKLSSSIYQFSRVYQFYPEKTTIVDLEVNHQGKSMRFPGHPSVLDLIFESREIEKHRLDELRSAVFLVLKALDSGAIELGWESLVEKKDQLPDSKLKNPEKKEFLPDSEPKPIDLSHCPQPNECLFPSCRCSFSPTAPLDVSLAELKFGRPAEVQRLIDLFIYLFRNQFTALAAPPATTKPV